MAENATQKALHWLRCIALVVILCGIALGAYKHFLTSDLPFDSARWKKASLGSGDRATRWRMRKDVARVIRKGMPAEEVEGLLGGKVAANSGGGLVTHGVRWAYPWVLVQYLRHADMFKSEGPALAVYFDSSERVTLVVTTNGSWD